MKHVTLFRLSLKHPFFADGRCRGLGLEPSAATRRLLRNHRLVLRPAFDGVHVLTPVDELGEVFLPLAEGTAFVFHLFREDPVFTLVSDLTAVDAEPAPLFTDQGIAPGQALQLTSWEGEPPVAAAGAWADVEVHAGGTPLAEQGFHIDFTARQALWAYYCVTDLAPAAGELAIVDVTPGNPPPPIVFSPANRRELNDQPDPEDRIARDLAERYGDLRRIRFLSDSAVAGREDLGRQLELQLDALRLFGPLPLPAAGSFSTVETAPDTPQDSLFQVFRYLTQPIT